MSLELVSASYCMFSFVIIWLRKLKFTEVRSPSFLKRVNFNIMLSSAIKSNIWYLLQNKLFLRDEKYWKEEVWVVFTLSYCPKKSFTKFSKEISLKFLETTSLCYYFYHSITKIKFIVKCIGVKNYFAFDFHIYIWQLLIFSSLTNFNSRNKKILHRTLLRKENLR